MHQCIVSAPKWQSFVLLIDVGLRGPGVPKHFQFRFRRCPKAAINNFDSLVMKSVNKRTSLRGRLKGIDPTGEFNELTEGRVMPWRHFQTLLFSGIDRYFYKERAER